MGKLKNFFMTWSCKHQVKEKPDKTIWIFSSVDNCHYNYNSRYLFEYVKDNLPQITPYFVMNDDKMREELGRKYGQNYFIETNTKQGVQKVLKAGVWFTSAGLPVYGTHLKKDRIIVNLWHGVPLKQIALSDPNLKKAARIYFHKIFTENYTYILTTSSTLVPVMAKSFDVPESMVRVWGQPRNDRIFMPNDREKTLEAIYGKLPEYDKAVLYAPTYRDGGATKLFPFPDYDKTSLNEFLEKEKILLFLRTHISEKTAAGEYLSERIRFLGNEEAEDATDILNVFDLLVTDYSSIYIDYLLTEKPLIFLPYDKEEYLAERGMNFDYEKVTPGPKPATQKEFLELLKSMMTPSDPYEEERCRVNRFFNEVDAPCAGEICSHILEEI
ncbi:CDP-glycerol glycerophosphotransferase family protein [Blautia schinkii]|nr:CDP-glycerol glycerophosphotransferase family protein [Blautia schinkii]